MIFSRWRQLGRRLARMDQAELRDRLQQEFAKRQDAILSRFGHDFASQPNRRSGNTAGKFFFTGDSVDGILALLCQRFPGYKEKIVQQAEQICRHQFDLLGYTALDYGSAIDWHLDAVHGKRAPKKIFYKVPYLDYSAVGDSKVTWELNRHQHLVTLAKAYRLTGDRRYVDEIQGQWRDWQTQNPYPVGINWASSLEVAFRSLAWIWTYQLLQGSSCVSSGVPDFRTEWLPGLALHGRHIERYLSTYFSPNTHLLGEGVALFFLGVLCPELRAAERWKSLGWEIILREAQHQVGGDGFHFEQSTYYHVYALDFFMHAAVLARINNISPKPLEETLEKMLTALSALAREGPPPWFGDNDGGRLFDGRRNRVEHLIDPLAAGAIWFGRGDFKSAAGGLREETLWLLGVDGARQWDELGEAEITNESLVLPQAGFYLLTTGKTQLVVDAGPLGGDGGAHGHADALGVTLQSHGRQLLIDPGTYEYIGPGVERNLFRGTAMHNTLRVDGADQAEPAGPFAWRSLTHARAEQWMQGKNFELLVSSHDGYLRLQPPVTHRRWVVSLKNGIFLIRDVIEGEGTHHLDIGWHLGPDLRPDDDGLFQAQDSAVGLAILGAQPPGWKKEVRQESYSPVYGQKAPMTVLTFSADTVLPAEFAALLITLEGVQSGVKRFSRMEDSSEPGVSAYSYTGEDGEYSFMFGQRGHAWRVGSWSSDAEFVCWSRKMNGDEHLILYGGSYAEMERGSELRCRRPVDWAEVIQNKSGRTAFSSDIAAVEEHSATK